MQKNLEALAAVYQAVASLILVMDEVVLDRADAEKFARMNEDEWAVVAKILQDLFAACDDCRGIDQKLARDQMEKEIKGYAGLAEAD